MRFADEMYISGFHTLNYP